MGSRRERVDGRDGTAAMLEPRRTGIRDDGEMITAGGTEGLRNFDAVGSRCEYDEGSCFARTRTDRRTTEAESDRYEGAMLR